MNASNEICDEVAGATLKLKSSVVSSGIGTGYEMYDDNPLTVPENDGWSISKPKNFES